MISRFICKEKITPKELSNFFNEVRQAIFRFKPNGFDSRKAKSLKTYFEERYVKHKKILYLYDDL